MFWVLAAILLLAAGYTHYHFSKRDHLRDAQSYFAKYLEEQEKEIDKILADGEYLTTLTQLVTNDELEQDEVKRTLDLVEKPYTIFILDNQPSLVFWSNDEARSPDLNQLDDDSPYYRDKLSGNIYWVIRSQQLLQGKNHTILGFIPFKLTQLDNPYEHVNKNISTEIQLVREGGIPILSKGSGPSIHLQSDIEDRLSRREILILTGLYLLAILALGILIQKIAYLIREEMGANTAIGFFIFTTVGIRLVSLLFDFSGHFEAVSIFDPSIMAPAFPGSLSDLLINVCLFLWVSIFIVNTLEIKVPEQKPPVRYSAYAFTGYLTILGGLVFLTRFCQKLIQKTEINFNFESVFNLDQLSILALISIILLMFTLFVWSSKIVSIIQRFDLPIKHRIISGASALLLSLPLLHLAGSTVPLIQFALVAGIYILLLDIFLEVKTPNFTWVVLWLVVLSGFSSILLFKFNKDKDVALRKEVAHRLTHGVDSVALSEISNLLHELQVSTDSLITNSYARTYLREHLNNSSYLSSYYSLSFPESIGLSDIIQHEDFAFYRKSGQLDQYLLDVRTDDGKAMIASFTKRKTNPHSPLQSFVPTRNFKDIALLSEYDYAIYEHERCIERSHAGYKMVLEETIPPIGQSTLFYPSGRSELMVNNGDYVIIVGRRLTGLIKPVSLFSYLFVIIVIIILFLLILNSVFPYLPTEFNFTLSNQISLRNKIQVSVLALIILSFVIIGIVTVFYFQNAAENGYTERLEKTASSLQYELQEQIKRQQTKTLDSTFRASVDRLSIEYNSHIQLFDQQGLMVTSSDPLALELGILRDRMSLPSLIRLKKQNESIFIDHAHSPEIGKDLGSAYFSLKEGQGNHTLGYVGLPIPPGDTNTSNQVKDFMGTLLNVYVFLLLIAGAFALAVANSITRPLTVLGQKLKDFKLGKSNEPLEWKTKDEVGILIQEYNQMIVKLDESADLLALTEREVAWREMAKQVAHEIKNPLTPMRLSIQHLQHAMQNADPIESRQLVQRVGITLIEQIDNLSRIAAEFSTFAKMPKPQNEKIILNDLVASVHDLFKKRDDMDFNLYVPIDEIYVSADKSHLLRVLNNLIKNAIQAIPASRRGVLDIKLDTDDEKAIIQVVDNGKGISPEMREKVFYPNFTTKTSGTGLGLAISKNIIESFGGRIYFETEENTGTTFYFELPLLKNTETEYTFRHLSR